MKKSHLRNTLYLHIFFFLTKEISIHTSMLLKSRIQWWDRDCFLTIFTFYILVSSNDFSNSGITSFAIIVWPHHCHFYPKHLRSSCLPQQKYYPLLSRQAWNSWAPNFNKTYFSKTCSNSCFPHKSCAAYWAHRQISSKTPFHMPLDSLSKWLSAVPLVNLSPSFQKRPQPHSSVWSNSQFGSWFSGLVQLCHSKIQRILN